MHVLLFSHQVVSYSLWPMDCSMTSLPGPHYLPEFAQVYVHCIGVAVQPFHPLLPSSPSAFNFSQHLGLFQRVGSSHQIAKVWSCSFISPSKRYSGLISFRINWFALLAVQGTLNSPPEPQLESISSSVLCLLYGPALTSIHEYWKDHYLDTYLCICFLTHCLDLS